MEPRIQIFPALDDATEAALRASISRFGVLMPVVRDQHGRMLDGHHRERIAGELGVMYRVEVREVADDREAHEIARTLNEDRRQLPREQRMEVARVLRDEGHSLRAIGNALGVSHETVARDVRSTVTSVTVEPERIIGLDGKNRPAHREPQGRAATQTRIKGRLRRDTSQPFEVTKPRQRQIAEKVKDRLSVGLSEINGVSRGLQELDLMMVAAVATTDEVRAYTSLISQLAQRLKELKAQLSEVAKHAQEKVEDHTASGVGVAAAPAGAEVD